jgi:thiamine-phosphate pyrophosphorylase
MTSPPAPRPALFYPIVPDVHWLARLVPLGIKTVQLRIKDPRPETISADVADALAICRAHGCDLIVNDHWQAAIDAGASLVHLGQEDLAAADLPAIRRAGIYIGVSTHSEEELDTALAAGPCYVALGPIYETKLKVMKWAPQGLERIGQWKRRLGDLPLVAIGGITPDRAGAVLAAGADSVAVITDFMTSPHPEARVSLWLDWAARQAAPH